MLHKLPYKTNSLMRCRYLSFVIPLSGVVALLLMGIFSLANYRPAFAFTCNSPATTDFGTVTPITLPSAPAATASMSLSKASLASNAVKPGEVATMSTNVTVSVGDASSYSLTLKANSTTITNGKTTLIAGDVTADNTWGYKWDNATTYTAPTTAGTRLNIPKLNNGAISFTKPLTFGAKFASDAEGGHYKTSGILSLVASPKTTSATLANITEMQQINSDICANTPYLSGYNYSAEYNLKDVRDNHYYKVRKLGDGRCWMTENLALGTGPAGQDTTGSYNCGGRILNSTTSDVSSETHLWFSWASNPFNDDTRDDMTIKNGTGYYTWCAATAGTCTSATSQGANATSSICPKNWTLPTGTVVGANTTNDFWNLFRNMGLTISNDSLASNSGGYTSWGSGDLAKAQGSPYNFAYTGFMPDYLSNSNGFWWSRTASSGTDAYSLCIDSNIVYPGTYNNNRRFGYVVRCVAE